MIITKEQNKIAKGNIPIQEKLLNKYSGAEEIFDSEGKKILNIVVINKVNILNEINIIRLKTEEIKQIANIIFNQYHNKNFFVNNGNKIIVSKSGINESIQKIYFNRFQKELLLEHLKVFSNLGKIIENATLVNQVYERKGRKKYNSWNYYLDGIMIDNKEYLIEFEVVSMMDGKNHYRIQRLKSK